MAKFRRSHGDGKGISLGNVYLKVIFFSLILFLLLIGGIYLYEKEYNKSISVVNTEESSYKVPFNYNLFLPYINHGHVDASPGFSYCFSNKYDISLWVSALIGYQNDTLVLLNAQELSKNEKSKLVENYPLSVSSISVSYLINPFLIKDRSIAASTKVNSAINALEGPRSFIEIVWYQLNTFLVYLSKVYGDVIIITGPVIKNNAAFISGNENHVAIEIESYYVMISNTLSDSLQTISFVFALKETEKEVNLKGSLTDINTIQKLTGIEFFDDIANVNKSEHSIDYLQALDDFYKNIKLSD